MNVSTAARSLETQPAGSAPFRSRHLGPSDATAAEMAREIGYQSVQELVDRAVPASIRRSASFDLPEALSESSALAELRRLMQQNQVQRSLIGMGYYDCITPPVILRNILENPGWYTAYTPYQPEISQGRLEACLNFQTLITELSGLDVANASLLDEATAAAEAMAMCAAGNRKATSFFVADNVHPQTIAVLKTRAEPLGITIQVGPFDSFTPSDDCFGILLQYPGTDGAIYDYSAVISEARESKLKVVLSCDLLALTLLKSPGELGADIAVGSAQRFGVPLGFGGPHAGWIACADALKRKLPGRLVGVSKDAHGNLAYRLALQTREQHIRRDKATSNICTAQVLLAVIASMYAVYHGPDGLRRIAKKVHGHAQAFAAGLAAAGINVRHGQFFDTVRLEDAEHAVHGKLHEAGFNVRQWDDGDISVSFDEKSSDQEVAALLKLISEDGRSPSTDQAELPETLLRSDDYLQQPVFHAYHTETEMMRYLHRLESKDLALNTSMIPLGSCTMKLNAAAEMMPISWPEVNGLHPFAPQHQWPGYAEMIGQLEAWLAECTGFAAVSLQPNAGSQGEYAGLLAIREYHHSRGDQNRDVCLIPVSAHGTNPASAVMAGMKVVAIDCDDDGNIDVLSLKAKAEEHADRLAALMVTYPSTHGVFEESIRDVCQIVHDRGGQVYMDGANLNAQLGLCSPGEIGADVCHLNLHKTFCIPHGGGGPGVGPIGVAEHLAPFLPGHIQFLDQGIGPVSAAPFGSASILTISWMYIAMMGADGLTDATRIAILNANYIAHRLNPYFPVLYKGESGLVAHECILDLRPFKDETGVEVEDVAKRLMDYGFHAPTMSWPVAGTLMIEPTESESKEELDRFCDAMISIHAEMMDIRDGRADRHDNVLKNAPHTAASLLAETWTHGYSREQAAYPVERLRDFKYWPPVGRVDNVYGDRHLVCTCPDVNSLAE
ncbi:MAG: aminomethyl-transferring glycine dehydrogenase [Fuerstiella sp.]